MRHSTKCSTCGQEASGAACWPVTHPAPVREIPIAKIDGFPTAPVSFPVHRAVCRDRHRAKVLAVAKTRLWKAFALYRVHLTRSLAVDTRESLSTWLWENFSCKVSISGNAKRLLSDPRALSPWKGRWETSRLLKGANHEIHLPGLRGREVVGCNVRERARSHDRGMF